MHPANGTVTLEVLQLLYLKNVLYIYIIKTIILALIKSFKMGNIFTQEF